MYNSLTLTPAYGRDYKSKQSLIADWDADKDFVVNDYKSPSGTYVNKQQVPGLQSEHITHLHFRYQHNTKVHVIKL